ASALAQTTERVEVVVVDDGSDEPFRPADPGERVRVLRNETSTGVCAARNAGLVAGSGRWVTFLDDDDRLVPEMAELSLDAAAASALPPPVSVLSAIDVVDTTGAVSQRLVPASYPRGAHYFLDPSPPGTARAPNALFVRRDLLLGIGGWDERLRAFEHGDLLFRLNEVSSLQAIEKTTYLMSDHGGER
ncbi:MAG: glycosyltransferase family 2 protein, partial [Actinomycetota bacterium]|nr:glycosyltransferase family 2 protein [Actinomycetota bacterium]